MTGTPRKSERRHCGLSLKRCLPNSDVDFFGALVSATTEGVHPPQVTPRWHNAFHRRIPREVADLAVNFRRAARLPHAACDGSAHVFEDQSVVVAI
jgi:hypothetical protein